MLGKDYVRVREDTVHKTRDLEGFLVAAERNSPEGEERSTSEEPRKDYNVARSIALETQQFVVRVRGRESGFTFARNGRDLPRLCPSSVSTLSVPTKILPPPRPPPCTQNVSLQRFCFLSRRSRSKKRDKNRTTVRYFRVKFCETTNVAFVVTRF